MIPADIPNMIALIPHAPPAPAWWMPRISVEMPERERKATVRNAILQVERSRGIDIKDRDVIATLEQSRGVPMLASRDEGSMAIKDVAQLVHEASVTYAEQQRLIREAKWRVNWAGLMLAVLQDEVGAASPGSVVQPVFESPIQIEPPPADTVPVKVKARRGV